jgi:predicted ribosome quality control (RQC) complex YloA/Tae2 family protein
MNAPDGPIFGDVMAVMMKFGGAAACRPLSTLSFLQTKTPINTNMKQRFSSLDVKVIAHELSSALVSLRVSNIYDLSSRIFLFKFAKPERREQLIIDSGFRCHLTTFARATAAAPSPFIARLRKYLRTRRVTSVAQIGTDRIIDIQFSDGQYHLFLEFYAGGNIVLTDNELNIIGLLRNVDEGAEHERYRLGLPYNLELRQNYGGVPPLTKDRVRAGLEKAIERQSQDQSTKKIKRKPGDALRKALAVTITEFPPVVLDHVFEVTGFDKTVQPSEVLENEETLDKLMAVFEEATKVLADITSAETATGYIVCKRTKKATADAAGDGKAEEDKAKGLMYDDFHPFKPKQLENNPDNVFLEFTGFNKTVDEFFSSIEGQKLESKLNEREELAKKRLESARQEHARRIGSLQQTQELNVTKAQAIEANLDRVEEATAAVNGLIAQGMDWIEVERLIEMEQSRNNPVAEIIKLPLKLEENTVTLLLSDYSYEEEEEMGDVTESDNSDSEDEVDDKKKSTRDSQREDKRLTVDIDLSLSGWSNARQYYDQKRVAATKQEKTEQASTKALKSTEQRIQADLKKGLKQEKAVLRPVRKQLWFEKFIYFISSDGYLVLGGKDAQQNELLYRRHLKKGDIYVHADLHGAASVIIKNNPGLAEFEIPPSTLSQAGNLSVCTSGAWDSKAVMSAWWVNADQVSKTAPTGEYLTTGGFMIRGKKNFLPPAQLLLGFAVIWQISEESKGKHVKHRLQNDDVRGMTQEANSKAAANDDSDDDFPDAGKDDASDDEFPDVKDEGKSDESDDDDDLPDAKDDASPASEGATTPEERSNPLQPKAAQQSDDDTSSSASESEGEEETVDKDEESKPEVSETAQPQSQGKKAGGKGKGDNSKNIPNQPKQNKPVRGKRGKAKKAAQKYADQDDEDRQLAMEILGSKAAEEKRDAEEEEKAKKAESAEAAKERRRLQHEKAQREGLEAEEIRRLNLEEGIEALDEEESTAVTQLDAYVGTPLAGDELLEAIPVCAPWAALAKYKYKVKLQPGAQKKGRAIREIMDSWTKAGAVSKWVDPTMTDTERIWPRELELIKNWKDVEVIGVLPVSKVRVMMSGGAHGSGGGSGGGQKGKGKRGGKGSKKSR